MATITTRSGKGSPLTNTEVDDNFTNLNTAKYESGDDVTVGNINSTGNLSITAGAARSEQYIQVGTGMESGYAYLDLVGDDTYTDYGFRIIRGNGGANTTSSLQHRGTGNFYINASDGTATNPNSIVMNETGSVTHFRVESDANSNMFFVDGENNSVNIGTNSHYDDNYKLNVSGRIRTHTGGSTPDNTSASALQGLLFTGGNQRLNIDVSNATNGGAYLQTRHNAVTTYPEAYYALKLNPLGGNVIVNEEGHVNGDFRVESDGNSDMLFVDASSDRVGIGHGSPQTTLHVFHPVNEGIRLQSPTANNSFGDENRIDFHMSNQISQATGNPAARIASYLEGENNMYGLKFAVRSNANTFNTAMTIAANGEIGMGRTDPGHDLHLYTATGGTDFMVESGDTGIAGMYLKNSDHTFRIYTENDQLYFYDTSNARATMKVDTQGSLVLYSGLIGPGDGTYDMRNITANASTEEPHFRHAYLNNSWGHFVERGGSVSVVGLSGSPSTANLAKMFHSSAQNCGINNSDYQADTIDLIMTSAPSGLTYGSYGSITFGNSGWAATSVTVYVSSNHGSTWTQIYSSTATRTNHTWYWSTGSSQTNAMKITLGRPANNSSMRINNITAYNYSGWGTEMYHLPRRGGNLFGGLIVNELSETDADFRVESDAQSDMLVVDSSANRVVIGGTSQAAVLTVQGGTTSEESFWVYGQATGKGGRIATIRDSRATPGTDGSAGLRFTSSPGTDYVIGKYYDGSASNFMLTDQSGNEYYTIEGGVNNVFNQSGMSSRDFRVETSVASHTLFVDSGTGLVGINKSNPSFKLHVQGSTIGSSDGDTTTHAAISGYRHHLDFKELRTANASDWNNTTYRLQMRVDSTNHQAIDFVSSNTYEKHIDIRTSNTTFHSRFTHGGRLGVGTETPSEKLEVNGHAVTSEGYNHFFERVKYWARPAGANSYSSTESTAMSTSSSYRVPPGNSGMIPIAVINTRAFQNYVCVKTNYTSNNLMYQLRYQGYMYGMGICDAHAGGYTYGSPANSVLSKSQYRDSNAGNQYIADQYRLSTGHLCFKIYLGHTGYTEGQGVLWFGGHGDSWRNIQVLAVQIRNDGTNHQF